MKVQVLSENGYDEEWKSITDFPNYEVSSLGRVKNIITNKLKACRVDLFGYKCTDLYNNGKSKTIKIHKLVAEAFIGDRPLNYDINHIDGNKQNNVYTNLEYCTRSENIRHAFKLGLIKVDDVWREKSRLAAKSKIGKFLGENNPNFGIPFSEQRKKHISESLIGKRVGESNPRAKLTENKVREIRSLYATKQWLQKDLAEIFGVDQTIINSIVLRKIWKHVE